MSLKNEEQILCIGESWYQYGLNLYNEYHEKDVKVDPWPIYFVCFWMSFNWLYQSEEFNYRDSNKKLTTEEITRKNNDERRRIRKICDKYLDDIRNSLTLNEEFLSIFYEGAVYGKGYEEDQQRAKNLFEDFRDHDDEYRQRLKSLMLTIYQVRCNLIHGEKMPYRKRDIQLVEASTEVLRIVLDAIFNSKKYHSNMGIVEKDK